MKIKKKGMSIIAAVQDPIEPGTRFYVITDKDLRRAWAEKENPNCWFKWAINRYGLDAFDFKRKRHQSRYAHGTAIIYETDNKPITLTNGKEVSPEDALKNYTSADWEAYLEYADNEVIRRLLSPYELKKFTRSEQMQIRLELEKLGYSKDDISYDLQELHTVYKN